MTVSARIADTAFREFKDPAALDAASSFWMHFLDVMHALDAVQTNHCREFDLLGLRAGFELLDVGCGTGNFVRDAARLVAPSGRVVGIDLSAALLGIANTRTSSLGPPVAYHLADAAMLPFPDATFDGSRTERVLQYLEEPHLAIAELQRVTKTGGRVVATETDWDGIVIDYPDINRDTWRRAMAAISDGSGNGWMGRQLRRLFLDAGLDAVTCEGTIAFVTDSATGMERLAARSSIERARDAGAITAEEADDMIAAAFALGEHGRFLLGIPLVTVSGRVP